MNKNENEKLWVEKYRPQTLEDLIIPQKTKEVFQGFINSGDIPNLILHSSVPGSGKSSASLVLCHALNMDVLKINASLDNSIDVLRNRITNFASSVSLTDRPKCVILDEADGLSQNAFQPALRGFIEEFSQNVRFIMTCNYIDKIIPAVLSRCAVIEFNVKSDEKPSLIKESYKRVTSILNEENVKFDPKTVAKMITLSYPDLRKVINTLQNYSAAGEIDEGILKSFSKGNFDELVSYLKQKKYTDMRQWVGRNKDIDATKVFRYFYDHDSEIFVNDSIPQAVLVTGQYEVWDTQVADREINLAAYLTQIMVSCQFK